MLTTAKSANIGFLQVVQLFEKNFLGVNYVRKNIRV